MLPKQARFLGTTVLAQRAQTGSETG